MLQITKQGNSIVVKGLDHAFYPYSGTLEIPCNSVITVVDESDIVTFRSASNYDVLFSGLVTQITINGETVTKENVGDKFGAIANTKYGLTPEQEEKLNNSVQIANYNADKEAQATIDDSQNASIEGLRGGLEGKQDKINDLDAIREGAEKGATALQEETDPVWTAEKGNYYTKSEVNSSLESKANKSEIPTVPTNVSEFTNDAGYLTEHQSLDNYYTKSEVNTSLETKANKSEIPSLNGYATEQWVGQQGYLTEHQDISGKLDKTEASETYQPKGNYATKNEIPSLDGYATESWVEGKGYLTEHQSLADYAKTSDVNTKLEKKQDVITDLNAIREGANKGSTAIQEHQSLDGYATESWVEGKGYLTEHQTLKTINGQTIVGDGNIEIQGGVGEETDPVWTADKVNYYTKVETDDLVGNVRTTAEGASSVASTAQSKADEALAKLDSKADKSEIPSLDGYATEQWVEGKGYLTEHQDISGKLDKTEAASTYQPKGNYVTKDEIPSLEGYATEEWVNSKGYLTEHQDISGKLDKTEAASTYQPKGDYLTEETDPIWTAEKVNYYTKTEVDAMIGNINNALATLING